MLVLPDLRSVLQRFAQQMQRSSPMIAALAEGADVEVRTKDGFVFRMFPNKKIQITSRKKHVGCVGI
jgi:hypothetical protein